jgi:hypothetical protein
MKLQHQTDLILSVALAIACTLIALFPLPEWIRLIASIGLGVILPGYAVLCAFFPSGELRGEERTLIATGIGMIGVILLGVVFNLTPWGIHTVLWVIGFNAIILGADAVCWFRRSKLTEPPAPLHIPLKPRDGVFFLVSIGLVIGAVAIARLPLQDTSKVEGYSVLWMLPGDKQTPDQIRLGVMCDQFERTHYRLVLSVDGTMIGEWTDIELNPGDQWETKFTIPSAYSGGKMIEAYLYRADVSKDVYRYVKIPIAQ